MRVLGVDPGLTRCGVGVVEGVAGRPLTHASASASSAPRPTRTLGERLVADRARHRAVARRVPARMRRRRAGVQPAQRPHRDGHRAGQRRRHPVRRTPRPAGRPAHPQRGQGRRHRHRPRGQGPGRRDGDPAAAARRAAQTRRRRRRPGAGHLPHLARPGDQPPSAGRRSARARSTARDRLRHRPGRRPRPGLRRRRGRRRRHGRAVRPQHPGRAADRRAGPARHLAWWSARTRSPSTASPTTTSARSSSCCRPPAASAPGSPRRCWPCTAPTRCGVAVATGDEKALTAVPGIGKKGAQRLLLELKDRLGAPRGTVGRPAAAAGPASWREQLHAALVGLGYQPREADDAVDAVAPQAEAAGEPNVGALLRSALQTLNRAR